MNNKGTLAKELIGRTLLVGLCVGGFLVKWWIPLIVAPVFWHVWDVAGRSRSRVANPVSRLIADGVTWILGIGYIVYSIASFGLNVGHWYGWLIGVLVALVGTELLGLIWIFRRNSERVEGNL